METELPKVKFHLPRWLLILYISLTVLLVPWIVVLSYSLPGRHLSRHWDLAWVGFDFAMLVVFGLTAYLGTKRSGWVALTSMSLATLLVVDAWFDALTARPGTQAKFALIMALFIELPLATVSFWLAQKVARQLVKSSNAND